MHRCKSAPLRCSNRQLRAVHLLCARVLPQSRRWVHRNLLLKWYRRERKFNRRLPRLPPFEVWIRRISLIPMAISKSMDKTILSGHKVRTRSDQPVLSQGIDRDHACRSQVMKDRESATLIAWINIRGAPQETVLNRTIEQLTILSVAQGTSKISGH